MRRTPRRAGWVPGFLVVASMVVGCGDEDLGDLEGASRVEVARVARATVAAGSTSGMWNPAKVTMI